MAAEAAGAAATLAATAAALTPSSAQEARWDLALRSGGRRRCHTAILY